MRLFPAVVSTSVLCLAAVACGGTDNSSVEPATTNGETAAPETTQAESEPAATNPETAATTQAESEPAATNPETAATTQAESELLPDGCTLAPFTIEAQRAGTSPAGAAEFQVTDAIAVPIPIVPDPDSTLDASAKAELAMTTDLLGYSVVFGDEPLGDNGAMFFDYEPSAEGKTRGQVSIYPATPTPIVAGDVVTYTTTTGLSFPLPTIGLDLVTFGDDTNSYLNLPTGQIAVLAITDDVVCLDVDLTWTVNSPKDNVLTIKGLITGRLLDRSTIIALG